MAKLLYGWERKRYEKERERRWDENWNQWKKKFLRTRNLERGAML